MLANYVATTSLVVLFSDDEKRTRARGRRGGGSSSSLSSARRFALFKNNEATTHQQLVHQWAPKTLKNSTLNTPFSILSKTLKIAILKNVLLFLRGYF
jgi:hypothetical protein